MGRESRNNPTAQQSNAGKLMSRQSFLGKVDHAIERLSLESLLAHKRIEALEDRIAALESDREPAVVRESVMNQ